jgi:hypothetical protein
MKTLSIVTAAIFLGLGGTVMAADSGENHQDNTNTGGSASRYMTYNAPTYRAGGYEALAKSPAPHQVAKPHVAK